MVERPRRAHQAGILLCASIAVASYGACVVRSAHVGSSAAGSQSVSFSGGSFTVEPGECESIDAARLREWAERAHADMSTAWPDRAKRFRVSGLRLLGRLDPQAAGAPASGYWDRERETIVFRCGVEEVVRHELFHVYCEHAALPCDCRRIDHPGGYDLSCAPAGD